MDTIVAPDKQQFNVKVIQAVLRLHNSLITRYNLVVSLFAFSTKSLL